MSASELPSCIGVFDSGLGGLTVVRALRSLLPHETILYFGDTARVPYGSKDKETIIQYARESQAFLEKVGQEYQERLSSKSSHFLHPPLKLIVVACNTVSAVALPTLRKFSSVPIVGVIQPAVLAALQQSKQKKIGVIGTEATIKSNAYLEAISTRDSGAVCWMKATPLLVPLVENGWINNEVTFKTLEVYFQDFRPPLFDTLILGCTHYPLLRGIIEQQMGQECTVVDSAENTAIQVRSLLQKRNWINKQEQQGELLCFVSDAPAHFQQVAESFLGFRLEHVEKVHIAKYLS